MQFGELLPESDAGMRQPAADKSAQSFEQACEFLQFSSEAN